MNFLVLKNIQGPKISTGSQANVDYEVITIYDLSRIISDIDDEKKIAEIHDVVMVEYIVEATGAIGVKTGASYNLTSVQRLIKQIGFDSKKEFEEINTFGQEVEAFVKELAELTTEQRTILYEMVYKSQTIQNDPMTVYITSNLVAVHFKGRESLVVDSLIDLDLVRIDREFRVSSWEREITALVLRHGSVFDLNIFYELKKFANNDQDLLQKMFISLDFSCLKL